MLEILDRQSTGLTPMATGPGSWAQHDLTRWLNRQDRSLSKKIVSDQLSLSCRPDNFPAHQKPRTLQLHNPEGTSAAIAAHST